MCWARLRVAEGWGFWPWGGASVCARVPGRGLSLMGVAPPWALAALESGPPLPAGATGADRAAVARVVQCVLAPVRGPGAQPAERRGCGKRPARGCGDPELGSRLRHRPPSGADAAAARPGGAGCANLVGTGGSAGRPTAAHSAGAGHVEGEAEAGGFLALRSSGPSALPGGSGPNLPSPCTSSRWSTNLRVY